MKKTILKTIIASIALGISALTLTSCQDVIYYYIRKEVALEQGTMPGQILSIIRFGDRLYTSNGKIYSKDAGNSSYGNWSRMPSPGQYIMKLAADENYIYALDGRYEKDTYNGENILKTRNLYASSNGSSWTLVWGDISDRNKDELVLFCTNAITAGRRKAYFRLNGTVYELNGTAKPTTGMTLGSDTADTKPTPSTKCCASLNGTTYFFNSYAAVSDKDEKNVYFSDNGSIRHMMTGGTRGNSVSASGVSSIAPTGDSLLIGTTSGIRKYRRNSLTGELGAEAGFNTNADSIFTSQYDIPAMLCVDPDVPENQATIYASMIFTGTGSNSAQFNHMCLWAYYPSRGNWNRD